MTTPRAAWFCPSCQRYHSPDCLTCPVPVEAKEPPKWPERPIIRGSPSYGCEN